MESNVPFTRVVQRCFSVVVLGWPGVVAAQIPAAEYAARREALADAIGDGILLALGAGEPAHDYEEFGQESSFRYLTGILEPDVAMVLVIRDGEIARRMIFVPPRDPATEIWSGERLGLERAAARTGLVARERASLRPVVDSLLGATSLPLAVLGDLEGLAEGDEGPLSADAQLVQAIVDARPDARIGSAEALVQRLRGKKSPAELELIRKAVAMTVAAHEEAMRALEPGMNEFELEALIEYTFRRYGAERPAFASIVGSGPNATTLHYNRNDRFMNAGDLVVIDVGASYGGYAADVTRTLPVSGTFTPDQRAVYQIVRDAQAAAVRQVKPGGRAQLMSDSASAVIAAGLARLGLIESPTAVYDCGRPGALGTCPQYSLFYMHGLGHGIGLDVHDPDQYYFTGTLGVGSAFTVEPGIYVRPDVLEHLPETPRNRRLIAAIRSAVERYANIGVRIEDDYIVTERGVEWLSQAPREADEVERMMAQPPGIGPRRAEWVEWYRALR